VCTVSDGTVWYVGTGACTVTANQAGNDTYHAAPEASQTVNVDYRFDGFARRCRTAL